MSLTLPIAAGALLFFALQMLFWNVISRRSTSRADFLSRVWETEVEIEPEVGLKALRLSEKKALQKLLADNPLAVELANLIERSGLELTVAQLLGQMGGAGALGLLMALVAQVSPMMTVILVTIGLLLPLARVMHQKTTRATQFDEQLPQALELMSMLLRAGRSLPQAIESMSSELAAPASEEFAAISEGYRLGRPLPLTLKAVCQKYPKCRGFLAFTVAISVLGQTGGNLVHIIDKIRKGIEMENQYVLRLRSMTGEARTSAYILGAMPPLFSLFSALTNPEMFTLLLTTGPGKVILTISVALWAGGILWLRSLMSSKPT